MCRCSSCTCTCQEVFCLTSFLRKLAFDFFWMMQPRRMKHSKRKHPLSLSSWSWECLKFPLLMHFICTIPINNWFTVYSHLLLVQRWAAFVVFFCFFYSSSCLILRKLQQTLPWVKQCFSFCISFLTCACELLHPFLPKLSHTSRVILSLLSLCSQNTSLFSSLLRSLLKSIKDVLQIWQLKILMLLSNINFRVL